MSVNDRIIQTLDPKITPPILDVMDFESTGSGNKIRDPQASGYAANLGLNSPFVKVGNVRISPNDIMGMSVYQNGIVPTIHISIVDANGTFTSIGYPRTNPTMTVFVASTHPKLKSFSQTFLITEVNSMQIDKFLIRYELVGELYIPKMNQNVIKAYKSMTSVKAIKSIAADLQLGFATNEDTMNDSMTWINPNLNYKAFIKQITDRSYKNDTSFFDCFIDRYYVLNFVNVEKQFKLEGEPDDGYYASYQGYFDTSRVEMNSNKLADEDQAPIILTNSTFVTAGSELRITKYSIIGDNGSILKNEGFRKKIVTYRNGEDSPVKEWFAEPISSQAVPDGPIHQTPLLDDYTDGSAIVKWMGVDYKNAHTNYTFAKLLNTHNRLETEKTLLRIELNGFNQNISRGSRVLVNIFKTPFEIISDNRAKDDDLNQENLKSYDGSDSSIATEIIDDYLSSFYYVKEISYHFSSSDPTIPFTTIMLLSRRSWKVEPLKQLS